MGSGSDMLFKASRIKEVEKWRRITVIRDIDMKVEIAGQK